MEVKEKRQVPILKDDVYDVELKKDLMYKCVLVAGSENGRILTDGSRVQVFFIEKVLCDDDTEEILTDATLQLRTVAIGGAKWPDYYSECLQTMREGETARFKIHKDYAYKKYGGSSAVTLNLSKEFTWILIEFKYGNTMSWKRPVLNPCDDLMQEVLLNEKDRLEANELYRRGKYAEALKIYRKLLPQLHAIKTVDEKIIEILKTMKSQLQMNILVSLLANKEFASCLRDCEQEIFKLEEARMPGMAKLHRIKSKALQGLDQWERAETEMRKCCELEPSDENRKAFETLKVEIGKMEKVKSKIYRKMLSIEPITLAETLYEKIMSDKARQAQCAVIAFEQIREVSPLITDEEVEHIVSTIFQGERGEILVHRLKKHMKEDQIAPFLQDLIDRAEILDQQQH